MKREGKLIRTEVGANSLKMKNITVRRHWALNAIIVLVAIASLAFGTITPSDKKEKESLPTYKVRLICNECLFCVSWGFFKI